MSYNWNAIEEKWQKYWKENQTFKVDNNATTPKYYVLDMFPYPSGAGLHVGHPLGYIASDIYARYKRHKGFHVLHPQGYDSFGLPAEQYAIQTGQHPSVTTQQNIKTYRQQLDRIGFSFDWSREVRTSNPKYYKWTQWIFSLLFNSWYCKHTNQSFPINELIEVFKKEGNAAIEAACSDDAPIFTAAQWKAFNEERKQEILLNYRLAYLAETEVNWCAELGTVLANDEVINGVSERGGFPVIRKKMRQWSLRISAYAERLLQGLESIDWTDAIKETQRNWIGKSVGAEVQFKVANSSETITVFTTRPDTIFGVSFMVLAPENELVKKLVSKEQQKEVQFYIEETAKRSERERLADVKRISGAFLGAYAIHPFTNEKLPIWISDYVLSGYGTGAVMAVPCGDQRDYDFAKHFQLAIPNIFKNVDLKKEAFIDKENTIIINSDFLNNLNYKEATKKVIKALEQKKAGKGTVNYRLRDAVFSRQRYWGEPFPVYYINKIPYLIDEKYLPLQLPEVEKYVPTETGEPPLGRAKNWAWDTQKNTVVSNKKIDNKTVFPLELNTMPGWAGSSWYFFRYMEDKNRELQFATKEALAYWNNVDLYIGGSEHATGHLLYARFWTKFLFDNGLVFTKEPFQKLINQGMILGNSAIIYRMTGTNTYVSFGLKDKYKVDKIRVDVNLVNTSNELDLEALKKWQPQYQEAEFILEDNTYKVGREIEKMSKRWYNVVNPDAICQKYGADSLRLYEMFLGPLEQTKPWNTSGITGVHSFLKKLWKLYINEQETIVTNSEPTKENLKTLHKTIKKVEEDIENFSFNTSVATFMIAVNEFAQQKCSSKNVLEPFLILLSPYAPHIAEELWNRLGNTTSISTATFPKFEEKYITESTKNYPISFNGKTRFTLELSLDLNKEEIEKIVLKHQKTQAQLQGRIPKKVIVVPGKIVNIVG